MASRISSGVPPQSGGPQTKSASSKQRQFADLAATKKTANARSQKGQEARADRLDRVEIKAQKSQGSLEKVSQHKVKLNTQRNDLNQSVSTARSALDKNAAAIAEARKEASLENQASQQRFESKMVAMTANATALSAAAGQNGEALSLRSAVAGQRTQNSADKIQEGYAAQNLVRDQQAAQQRKADAEPAKLKESNQKQQVQDAYIQREVEQTSMASASMSIDVSVDTPMNDFVESPSLDVSADEALAFNDQLELAAALKRTVEQEGKLEAAREAISTAREQMENLDKEADMAELAFAETLRDEAFNIEKRQAVLDARRVIENRDSRAPEASAPSQLESNIGVSDSLDGQRNELLAQPSTPSRDVAQEMIGMREETLEVSGRVRADAHDARLAIKEAVERLSVLESDAGTKVTSAQSDIKKLTTAMGERIQGPRIDNSEEARRIAEEIARQTVESPSAALASQPFLSVQTALKVLN